MRAWRRSKLASRSPICPASPIRPARPSSGRCRRSATRTSRRCTSARRSASSSKPPTPTRRAPQVEEMCERLLANPVIEAYAVTISELAPDRVTAARRCRPLPGLELRARRRLGGRAARRRRRDPAGTATTTTQRRRRGRRPRRFRARRLPAHRRDRAVLAGDERGRRVRGRGRPGRRHLQRLPGAHRSASCSPARCRRTRA